MTLWIILTIMCSAAAVLVAVPLIRRYEAYGAREADAGIYQDQLKEVERDRENGQIGQSEAELATVEIQRRLLASVKNAEAPRPVSPVWRTVAIAAAGGFVVLGAVNLYALNGRPDLPAAQSATNAVTENAAVETQLPSATALGAGEIGTVIGNLAAKMKKNPDDAEGWRMLGWSYFNTQRFEQSAEAYAKAVALVPDNIGYVAAYAEALVQSADGMVVPKARILFERVLQSDAKDQRARFYMALGREQAGEFEPALDMWIALLDDAPEGAGWLADVRQRIEDLGKKTGRDTSAILAKSVVPVLDTANGSIAGDQQASVEAMIGQLAAKLEGNPVDRDGWAMMIRSLKVKGDMAAARLALARAQDVFKDDVSTRNQITALAQSLDVTTDVPSSSSAPVISQEDIAAVTALPADDQQAMIRGMVDRLSDKLAEAPHDAEGWKRLIRSRMVLNQPRQAREALRKALAEFSTDIVTSDDIATVARGLGVTAD